ncbi:MAG TPA: glycoside hydrolase family 27 protein [Aquihabitans sp.]|nr:glycoside hydrolase family 27 protein [Aquihabitans sp.]
MGTTAPSTDGPATAGPSVARFDPFAGPPHLHGAQRVGVRPGTELIHPLAATGARPLRFEVTGLPDGLHVDAEGIVRGRAPAEAGTHRLEVSVANAEGRAHDVVELVVGEALCLTPPLGWNSWNVYGAEVSAEVIVRTAEAMVATGLRDLGYQYVNIDDHWHAPRRARDGAPLAHPERFPDGIEPVARRVHQLGLKLGIYSDAAHLTCGRCFGGLGHEQVDARAYAAWGVDLLKYDYCFAPSSGDEARARYGAMGDALRATDRSIVLSVCEWGFRRPWRWAPEVGGALWRTTPDIFDTFSWSPFGVRHIARRNLRLADHAGPGRWNDPDMLLVGNRGRGASTGVLRLPNQLPAPLRGRRIWRFRGLSDHQVHSHVTLWAMMAAPLLASHDLAASSELDLALLTNPEVLAIDQDPLGAQARKVRAPLGLWQLAKPLRDGGVAISVTNLTRMRRRATVRIDRVAGAGHGPVPTSGRWHVRDAWEMRSLGERRQVEVDLAGHGSTLVVCRPA